MNKHPINTRENTKRGKKKKKKTSWEFFIANAVNLNVSASKCSLRIMFSQKTDQMNLRCILLCTSSNSSNSLLYFRRANDSIDTIRYSGRDFLRLIRLHLILIPFHEVAHMHTVLFLPTIEPGISRKQKKQERRNSQKNSTKSLSSMTPRQRLPFPILGITGSQRAKMEDFLFLYNWTKKASVIVLIK